MSATPGRILVGDRVAIFKRGKRGLYQADFHYAGQHRRRSLKTSNRKVAVERATKLAVRILEGTLDALDGGAHPASTAVHVSIDDAQNAFIASKKADGSQEKTLKKYDGVLRCFADFCGARRVQRVDQASLPLIDAFRKMRAETIVRGRPLSAAQKHFDVTLLKQFFTWCVDRKMAMENPLATQKNPRPPRKRKDRVLSLDQINAILNALPRRLLGPIAVLAFAGMRSANCRHLLVSDIDFSAGWIEVRSVPGARSKQGNDWRVPLHPRLRAILESLPQQTQGYYFTAPPSRKYPLGDHWINIKLLNEEFVQVLARLGILTGRFSGFTIHDLRHFFKTFCIRHGVPREFVDAWQGHASIKSASDYYVHIADADSLQLMANVPFGDGVPAADAG